MLSGPSHAEEVARRLPTGCVAASADQASAEAVQRAFMNEVFRVYTHDDVVGVELAGALKNVAALCCGISDGCGMGDNTRALLITRALSEISRLAECMGGRKETLAGLAGMGDLIVTCTSMHSRNHRAGILIGQGKSAQEAMDEVGAVVEGYYAARSAHELAQRYGVEMPGTVTSSASFLVFSAFQRAADHGRYHGKLLRRSFSAQFPEGVNVLCDRAG